MGHFAKVLNGTVIQVIVAEPEFFDGFVDTSPGEWLQTSYNTRGGKYYNANTNELHSDQSKAFRKNFAGVGYTYDKTKDAFIPPSPYPSWSLNAETCHWEAPKAAPTDGKLYTWNEGQQDWVELVLGA
jgi:hypothetical protein